MLKINAQSASLRSLVAAESKAAEIYHVENKNYYNH